MKLISTFLAFSFSLSGLMAQQSVYLKINHKLGGAPLVMNQASENNLGHAFTIGRVDYYISSISIQHDGGMQTAFPDVYILSKGTNEVNVLLGSADVNDIESISFGIGVESPVNNEDPAQWPSNHPLSYQSPSMHWGWSSGYRFACIEGDAGETLSQSFEMHGLWNENYFMQTIPVEAVEEDDNLYINLDADYREALRDINLSAGPINHGTNSNDLTMLNNFRNYVFSPASSTTDTQEQIAALTMLYPNPAQTSFRITGIHEQATIELRDMMGRTVLSSLVQPGAEIAVPAAGTYAVTIITANGNVYSQKVIVQP